MLNKKDLKALAREARKLASECTENGPEMENMWCGCAIGIVMHRAGVWNADDPPASEHLAASLDALLGGMPQDPGQHLSTGGIVSEATRQRVWGKEPTAVVFPLLALADELDNASNAAPQKASP